MITSILGISVSVLILRQQFPCDALNSGSISELFDYLGEVLNSMMLILIYLVTNFKGKKFCKIISKWTPTKKQKLPFF